MSRAARCLILDRMDPDVDPAREPPRCAHCGDVTGVYEPYVLVVGLHGSRASRPHLPLDAILYHRACHAGDGPKSVVSAP